MNKKKFLLLFILCCALPLAAAKLVLDMGWFSRGASSHGQWQQTEVFLLPATTEKAHWRLAVPASEECDNQCQRALFTVQQLYVGLGRKQQQLQPVLLGSAKAPEQFNVFSRLQPERSVPETLNKHILLIDQQGLVLLSYPAPATDADMAGVAKAIRQDLLKLFNYDRTSA